MSAILDRLTYLTIDHTQTWICQETGIPQSTLSYVLSGQRDLPVEYSISVTNAYARTVYQIFRGYGFSPDEARSYRYSAPNTVTSKENDIIEKLNDLALGHIARFYPDLYDNQDSEEFDKILQSVVKDITEGLEYNRTSMADFFDYV